MNEKGREFRKTIVSFDETDLRRKQLENEPTITEGRMHQGTLYVDINGKRIHYIKIGDHVSSNDHPTSNPNSNRDGLEIRLKKGTTERMAKNKEEKHIPKKFKILGFIAGTAAILTLIFPMSKNVYGNTIENNGGQIQNNQKDFMGRLEKGNLSDDELKDIINGVMNHIEYDKLKNPIGQRFNVPSENVIVDPNNPYSITIIDEYSRRNGTWSVKEGENVHRVSAPIGQLISDLATLQHLMNTDELVSREYVIETAKRIASEVEVLFPDGGIIVTDGDGEIQIVGTEIDRGMNYDGFVDYLQEEQGYDSGR